MKDVKINIHELGPIKDASILLAPFMIFTGQSNLGKSYVNFLSYYVFDFFSNNRITKFLLPKIEGKLWKDNSISFSFTVDELRLFMSNDVKEFMQDLLAYEGINCNVSFDFSQDIVQKFMIVATRISSKVKFEDHEFDFEELSISVNGQNSFNNVISFGRIDIDIASRVKVHLSKILLGDFKFTTMILPPGRASLSSNSFSIMKQVSNTGMYNQFLHDFDKIRRPFPLGIDNPNGNDEQFFLNQIARLINGDVVEDEGELYFKLEGGEKIPMSAAASSIREISPFLFMLKNHYFMLGNCSICFEEPEAHAHPEMQYGIADLLASCINKGAFIQMTTHSDYLLSRINQLIRLFNVREKNPESFEKSPFIRNKRQLLDPKMIKAYYFSRKDGKVVIEEQSLEDGVPFDTFRQALLDRRMFNDELEKMMDDDDE